MIKLKDKTKAITIQMREWNGNEYTPDFSADFFEAPYDPEDGAYVVDDVDYCIDMALDWKYARYDYQQDEDVDPESRLVEVNGVDL